MSASSEVGQVVAAIDRVTVAVCSMIAVQGYIEQKQHGLDPALGLILEAAQQVLDQAERS